MIRKATIQDISRIAEILVFVKRINYRPIFQDDDFSFNHLQVLSVAKQYANEDILSEIWVYDDGIVKGMIHLKGAEIAELYVDHFFQNQGVGAKLMEFAKADHSARFLWALEKNTDALRFYAAHGFRVTNIRKPQEGTTEYLVMLDRTP